VAAQDTLKYAEPEDWFFPVRESLGGALLMNETVAAAEKVFREDLDRTRAIRVRCFGLEQALSAERDYDAASSGAVRIVNGGNIPLKVADL